MTKAQRARRAKRIANQLELMVSALDELTMAAQESLDRLPESLQDAKPGDALQEEIEQYEQASADVDSARDALNEI